MAGRKEIGIFVPTVIQGITHLARSFLPPNRPEFKVVRDIPQ
jgi:hypothetical protein